MNRRQFVKVFGSLPLLGVLGRRMQFLPLVETQKEVGGDTKYPMGEGNLDESLRYSIRSDGEKLGTTGIYGVQSRLLQELFRRDNADHISLCMSPELFEALIPYFAASWGIDSDGKHHIAERWHTMMYERVLLFRDRKIPIDFTKAAR